MRRFNLLRYETSTNILKLYRLLQNQLTRFWYNNLMRKKTTKANHGKDPSLSQLLVRYNVAGSERSANFMLLVFCLICLSASFVIFQNSLEEIDAVAIRSALASSIRPVR